MNLQNSRTAVTVACVSLITGASVFSQRAGAQAQTAFSPNVPKSCTALEEISTGQTVIRKEARMGNENVDFSVPAGRVFKSYRALMRPENNANYTATVNLKYNDGTSSKAFSRKISMVRMKVYKLPFRTPTANQPFQINLNVGTDRNNAYSVAVLGCKK